MLYAMGQAAGRSTARTIIEEFGAATVTKHVPAALDIYSSLGWAQASGLKSDFDGARAEIQVVDNFECLPHKGQDQKPYSNFLRGHLAGLFSELMGKRVDAEETNCIAQGDPCCLFKIAPAGQGDSK
jgi:predicted hydrocarbon binding protein